MPTSSSFGATQESTTPGCVCCGGNLVGEGRPTADRPNEPGPPYICRPTGETLQEIPSCCASTTGQIAEEEAETTTTLTETTTTQAATSTETTTETTTSTATTATRTATTTGTTTGTTVVGLPAIPWALNDIDKSLSQTVKEVGANGQCDINTTDLGQQYVCPVNTLKSEGTPVTQELSAKILFTPSFLNSVPAGTVIAMLETKPKLSSRNSLTSDPFDALKGESNQRLATNPFDITMYNPDGTKRVKVQLAEPLVFRLPQKATSENLGDPVCVYLEELPGGGFRWSTEGVRRATAEEVIAAGGNPAGFWCVTNHLSLFAMIAEILLGCLNVELLSPEAMASIGDQPGWYSSRPSVVMWVLLVVLAACCAFGAWRDWDGLLWGRMNAKPKKKKTGPSIMQKIKVLGIRGFVEALFAESSKRGNPQVIAGIQRSLAVRTHVSEKCITANCWNGGAWIDSNSALPHKVLYHKVDYYSRTAEDVLRTELWDSDASGVLYRFGVNFLALHPLLDALRLAGGSMTCAKRVFLLTGTILGTVASNSLIFNFSGAARSWESSVECPLDPASTWFIVLTSLTSVVVNTLPNMTLLIVATKAERRLVWDAAWWVLCLAYVAFTGIIVLTALANLNPLDQRTFHAGLEYALTVKLLLVPLFNTCKASFLLEKVLTEDKSKRRVFMDQFGVIDKRERELDQEARATAQKISNQAITLEQLVNFYSMLGRTVMPDFDPNKSTSYDVVEGGLKTLSLKHESNVDLALGIEVIEVVGVHHSKPSEKAQLACSVLHLGSMKELRRKCIAEYKSPATMANAPGSLQACTWNYSVKLEDADIEQALGFTVIDEGRVMGMACLPVQELVQKQGFEGELMLHDISSDEINASTYKMPAQAGKVGVAATELTGSRQEKKGKLGLSQQTRLKVKVDMPPKFLQALAQKERRKAKDAKPDHHSEVNAEYGAQAELCNILNAESNNPDGTMSASYGAFCEESSLPPDRVVVHSRGGNFLHFVSSVVVDALGDRQKNYDEVRRMLLERDFHGVLDMLNAAGRTGERYWIDMFATDLILGHNVLTGGKDRSHWHEELVAAMPTILRTLKRSCCDILKSDIEARKEPRCRLPVQVLILDPDNELVHTGGSLAEMMIARHAKWNQRLVLHPNHLKGESLSNELQQAQKQLQMKGFDNSLDQPWTHPYLEDKEAVYNTLSELVVGSVKEQMGDTPSIWQDLNLADVYATVGANQISQAVFDGAAGDFAAVAVEE